MAQTFKTAISIVSNAASAQAVAARVDGDTTNRINVDAGGKITWGDGSAAGDTTLYRSAADLLKTDDAFEAASLGVSGEFTLPTVDGSAGQVLVTDGLGSVSWGSSDQVFASDSPPVSPDVNDLWFRTSTGQLFIRYDSHWVEIAMPDKSSEIISTNLGGVAFSPLDFSPILWLDASDTSTIIESSGVVSQWNNKGSLNNFSVTIGGANPTTGVSTLNGNNVIDFASDYLTSDDSAAAYADLHNGTTCLVISVVRFGVSSNPNTVYSVVGNNRGTFSGRTGYMLHFDDRSTASRSNALTSNASNGSAWVTNNTIQNCVIPQQWHIVADIVDGDASPVLNRSKIFVDDGAVLQANTQTGVVTSSNPSFPLQVGAAGDNQFTLTGSIAELIILTGENATENNRQTLRDYLNSKWGVY